MDRKYKGILYYSNKWVALISHLAPRFCDIIFVYSYPLPLKTNSGSLRLKQHLALEQGKSDPYIPWYDSNTSFCSHLLFFEHCFMSCANKLDLAFPLFFLHWYPSCIVVWSRWPPFGQFLLSWPLSVLCYKTPLGEWESSLLFLVCLCMSVLVGYMTLHLVHVFST